jgi:hypothetical protein
MPAGADPLTLLLFAFSALLAIGAAVLLARVRSLAQRVAAAGGDPAALVRMVKLDEKVAAAADQLAQLTGRVDRLDGQTSRCLQRVGLVRYDAFQELGGHLSFSVALLDARQDGVVMSVLNDRNGARAYAKPVAGGRSSFTLSEEEERAITQA